MFYRDVKSAWEPLEMQAWLTKQSKQALRGSTVLVVVRPLYVRLPPLNMRALYCAAFPVDMVALGKVVRCVCMQRLFYADFFNSEHVWHLCGSFQKCVQKWQSRPSSCVAYVWKMLTYTAIWRTVISVGSYVPLMMWRRKPSWSCVHIFQNWKSCVLNASLLRGTRGTYRS